MLACSQLGPLRNVAGTAEVAGCLSGAALVGILTVCLTIYGGATFQEGSEMTKKTLSGRVLPTDELQSASGYVPPGVQAVLSAACWAYPTAPVLPFAGGLVYISRTAGCDG